MVQIFREVWRVLRPDGVVWLNLGDSYAGSGKGAWDNKSGGQKEVYIPDSNSPQALMPKVLPGLKPKDLCGIPWRVAFALQANGWYLRRDIIWCLSGGVKIYAKTPKSIAPTKLKDLTRLAPETVELWNGEKWTKVKNWYESNDSDDKLEIELRSGEKIGCTENHVWPTNRGLITARDLKPGDIINNCVLPESLKSESALAPWYAGWFVGLFIAEGSYGRNGKMIQISGHANEIERFKRLKLLVSIYGGTIKKHDYGNRSTVNIYSPVLRGILEYYINGLGAKSKHLNIWAWQRDNQFLDQVLEGYLEGDGHYDETNDRWRLGFTRNYAWAEDLRTICARLNYKISLRLSTSKIKDKEYLTFRGEIRQNESLHFNVRSQHEIVRIAKSRGRQFWDVEVEDEPHLFALASGVLTHNSKNNPMPESVTDRPTTSHEYVFLLTKKPRYFYDGDAIKEKAAYDGRKDTKMKGSKKYQDGFTPIQSKQTMTERGNERWPNRLDDGTHGRNARSVWTINTRGFNDWVYDFSTADYVDERGIPHKWSPNCPVHEQDGRLRQESPEVVFCDEPISSPEIDNAHKNENLDLKSSLSVSTKNDCKKSVVVDNPSCEHSENKDVNKKDGFLPSKVEDKKSFHTNDTLKEFDSSMKDLTAPSCESSAIGHSKDDNKNDHDGQTSEHDNASEEIAFHKSNKKPQLFLIELDQHISENNIKLYTSHQKKEAEKIFDKTDKFSYNKYKQEKCECQVKFVSHFATFPPELAARCIKAGTSEKGCCPECGASWMRVVEKSENSGTDGKQDNSDITLTHDALRHSGRIGETPSKTIGWQPTCDCTHTEEDLQPAIVLDPFGGSGTVLDVAQRLGRQAVVLDLKHEYCLMAKKRCYRPQTELFENR